MKKTLLFLAVVLMGLSMMAQTTYTKVTSVSELEAGANYIMVGYDEALGYCVLSYQKASNRHAIQVAEDGGSITLIPASDPSSQTEAFQITLGGSAGAWTFFDELKNGYLYAASSSANQLKTQTTNNANGEWNIVFEADGTAVVTANGDNTRNVLRFNENSQNGTPLFNCYLPTSSAGVAVAFYKEGGTPTIYPEPSNYPTALSTSHDMVDITVTWTDATGEQLPSKYLVLISAGNITVPTDGVPVANSAYAKNVSYGVQTATFTSLTPGTYNVAIFPYTNSGENIDYKTDGNYPTGSETTDMIMCLFASDFASSLAPFTAYDVLGDQAWTTGSYDGIPYAKMSGYSGGNHANEDWLITTNIFANNSFDEVTVSFMNSFKFAGEPLQILISEDYDGMSDPTEFNWVNVSDNFEWDTDVENYVWVETTNTLNVAGMSNLYIAFKFTSTDAASSTWEVAEFKVFTEWTSVDENTETSFNVYPNPATSSISVNAANDCELQIMDMAGRMVMTVNVVEGENSINVSNLESGVYFVRMNSAVVKFMKK
ncbi:MAG: T9SS type A sorting domain-containing protein [Bacteroidales bacterium]|nr:T9SS type A sorting domain-containing protein [Bacteroidales bacterium]